jgi:signal transduction histidine kinase
MGVLGQLAAGVAHDFNNLLTVILSSVELAQGLIDRAHPAREDLDTIAYAARRAAQLTRQLLGVSRKRAPSAEVVDLNALVVAPARLFRRLVGAGIEIEVAAATDVWPVRVDPGHVEQVLMNLVVNARDAMPGGGTLTVVTGNRVVYAPVPECPGLIPGEYAVLTVHDTGVGMDAETLAHVFEPFFTTKPPGRGTGLGLSTVQGIVRQWGGCVYAESAPGDGARFSVLLPRVRS